MEFRTSKDTGVHGVEENPGIFQGLPYKVIEDEDRRGYRAFSADKFLQRVGEVEETEKRRAYQRLSALSKDNILDGNSLPGGSVQFHPRIDSAS